MKNLMARLPRLKYALGAVLLFLLYYYPLQRISAEIHLNQYLQVQGITNDNIKYKQAHKDYTQDGYLFNIVLVDDDRLIYKYKYYWGKNSHEETYNIYCMIYKNNKQIPLRLVKYPPLSQLDNYRQ